MVWAFKISSGNTNLDIDGISVEQFSACLSNLGPQFTQNFHICLRLRYHPVCFELAQVVSLLKSGHNL